MLINLRRTIPAFFEIIQGMLSDAKIKSVRNLIGRVSTDLAPLEDDLKQYCGQHTIVLIDERLQPSHLDQIVRVHGHDAEPQNTLLPTDALRQLEQSDRKSSLG